MKILRNLNVVDALPMVTTRPEFIVICDFKFCAAFLLRVFEVEHMRLFDEYTLGDTLKGVSYENAVIQKWTNHKMKVAFSAVYRENAIPKALKLLSEKKYIKWEHYKEGGMYRGHNVTFLLENVQKAIELNRKEIHGLIETRINLNVVERRKQRQKLNKLITL
jgi:hypothetical protein